MTKSILYYCHFYNNQKMSTMSAKERSLFLTFYTLYEEEILVNNDTILEWSKMNHRLKKDDLFMSKVKTMKLTRSLVEKHNELFSSGLEYNIIACGGNMKTVAQVMMFEILCRITALYKKSKYSSDLSDLF